MLGLWGLCAGLHHRDLRASRLLCVGICPDKIVFNMWRKGEVAEEQAGRLVRMAEGQSVMTKITKHLKDMRPIEELPGVIRATPKLD